MSDIDFGHAGKASVPATDVSRTSNTNHPPMDTYQACIGYLQDEAAGDGYGLRHASKIHFERFVAANSHIDKCNLVLMDNGNLRAVWRDDKGTELGVQFLGSGMVQYVIFKRRRADRPVSRVAGRDSMEHLGRQIDAFDLHSLLFKP